MIYAFVSLHCYVKLLTVSVKAERLFQKVVRTLGDTGCNTDFCPTLVWLLFTPSSSYAARIMHDAL